MKIRSPRSSRGCVDDASMMHVCSLAITLAGKLPYSTVAWTISIRARPNVSGMFPRIVYSTAIRSLSTVGFDDDDVFASVCAKT
jgi:hypothetical protein